MCAAACMRMAACTGGIFVHDGTALATTITEAGVPVGETAAHGTARNTFVHRHGAARLLACTPYDTAESAPTPPGARAW